VSAVTGLVVYFCAFVCFEIFPKNTRELGVGHGQFLSGVSGLIKQRGKEKLGGIV